MKGSCLCGAVTYEVSALRHEDRPLLLPDLPQGACRPFRCDGPRAARSSRFSPGEDKLRFFKSSPGKLRRFCSVCGSHVLAERPAEPHVILRVATLDDDPGAKPLIHIWRSHEVPWCAPKATSRGLQNGRDSSRGRLRLHRRRRGLRRLRDGQPAVGGSQVARSGPGGRRAGTTGFGSRFRSAISSPSAIRARIGCSRPRRSRG